MADDHADASADRPADRPADAPAPSPYDVAMGFRPVHADGETARFEADVDAAWHNPTGRLHGGVLSGLADAAMGALFMTALPAGVAGTNLDLHMRFLRPVHQGRLTATASFVRKGRRVSVLACRIEDGAGRLVATAESAFLRLDRS